MKVGIMQPYFLPYIGYWQLMAEVDIYVIYDDVNFITRGWITRNRILENDSGKYINLPVLGVSQNKKINQVLTNPDSRQKDKLLRTIEYSYKKAPYFPNVYPLMEELMKHCDGKLNVAEFVKLSFEIITGYLGIKTKMIYSSEIPKDNSLKGEEKILSICSILGATEYHNAIGGKDTLYHGEAFERRGIELRFIKTNEVKYKQFNNEFVPNLSLLDVLMFNSIDTTKQMMNQFVLIK